MGNGEYEVTFVCTKGNNDFHLGNLKLLKRDEQLDEVKYDILLTKNRHKAQRKAKFYINKCRSASCMQGGLKQASA